MTKAELVQKVAERLGASKVEAERAIDAVGVEMFDALKVGEDVTLPFVGKFKPKAVAAKKGRNPQTGEAINIPAKNKVAFTAAKALKEAVA